MNSKSELKRRVFPEWEALYASFERALQRVWPNSAIPVELFVHTQIERGHLYTDMPLRCSRRYHVPLDEVQASLEQALELPETLHCSFVEGYANCRYTSIDSIPDLPAFEAPDDRPELVIAVLPPAAKEPGMAHYRLYARALFQAGLARSLGYSVRLIAGSMPRTDTIVSLWQQLVEESLSSKPSLEHLMTRCEEIASLSATRSTLYLSPRSLHAKAFRSFSKKFLHPESSIRMQCPTQRWCGEALEGVDKQIYSLEGLWYAAGSQHASHVDLSILQFQEMANRAWFYGSLFDRLNTLYQPEAVHQESFEGVFREQALLPAFVRQCAVFGMFDDWFSCLDRCLTSFLEVFHSPDGRQRLNDDSLLPHETQILSGAHAYLSDIIKHNSRLLEASISCEPL